MTTITPDMIDAWLINYGLDKRSPGEAARWWCDEMEGKAPAGAVAALGLLLQERETMHQYTELYRWLRANLTGVIHLLGDQSICVSGLTCDEFDASIRAAMRAEKFPGIDIDAAHRKA